MSDRPARALENGITQEDPDVRGYFNPQPDPGARLRLYLDLLGRIRVQKPSLPYK